jgi:conjugative relaxase-like TrwC/TraI family protein
VERGQLGHEPAVPGLVSYYGAGAAQWHGQGATVLGLDGDVASKDFAALLDGGSPDGLRLGQKFGDKSARAFDVTFSAPKDVSVLWALADPKTRATIETAFTDAVDAVLNGVEGRALSRTGIGGVISPIKTSGLAIAKVVEHTSRAGDPALHCHAVTFSKVQCADGKWRALDARELKWDQQALSAQFHRAMESELTRNLGIRWGVRTQWAAAPIQGFPPHLADMFSTRTQVIDTEFEARLERFEEGMGRAPTTREKHLLEREAVLATRPDKQAATLVLERSAVTSFHELWASQALDAGHDPAELIAEVMGQAPPIRFDSIDHNAIITTALEEVSVGRSSWRVGELARELARALPSGVDLTAAEVVAWSWDQAGALVKDHCIDLVKDPTPHLRRYTTQRILNQEYEILDFADRATTGRPCHIPDPSKTGGFVLTLPQHEAAQRLAGTEPLIIIEGPAGAGKTSSLKLGARELTKQGRHVFGVAPSAQAAKVLSQDAAIDTDTIHKLIQEYHQPGGPRSYWDLAAGTTLIIDEAGMASTPHLAALVELAVEHDWRIALVGDPRQLSAVGRGGMLDHLIRSRPELVTTLDTVHRFSSGWEQDASLRLRKGDTTVLTEYAEHDRLRTAEDPIDAAVAAWDQHRRQGSTALMAAHNETVAELNFRCQQLRREAGELGFTSIPGKGGGVVFVGDTVVTRVNDRRLGVMNREAWTITRINADGVALVNGDGAARVSQAWAHKNLELGYAATTHGRQGATLDHAITVHPVEHPLDRRGLYVGMTRGRETNLVFTDHPDPIKTLAVALDTNWIDAPAVTHLEAEQQLITKAQPEPVAAKTQPKAAAPAAPKAKKPVATTKPATPVAKATAKAPPKSEPVPVPIAKTKPPVTPSTPPTPASTPAPASNTPPKAKPAKRVVAPQPAPTAPPVALSIEEATNARRTAEMAMHLAKAAVDNTLDEYRQHHVRQEFDTNKLTKTTATLKEYQATKRSRVKYRKQIPDRVVTKAELVEAIQVRGETMKTLSRNLDVLRPQHSVAKKAFRDAQDVVMLSKGLDPETVRAETKRRGRGRGGRGL